MKKLYNQPEWKVLFIEEDIVTESESTYGYNGGDEAFERGDEKLDAWEW